MNVRKMAIALIVGASLCVPAAFAQTTDQGAGQDMKSAGSKAKGAAKDTGSATKKTAKKAGRKTKKGANKAAAKVKDKTE